jgi:hypothetical protein
MERFIELGGTLSMCMLYAFGSPPFPFGLDFELLTAADLRRSSRILLAPEGLQIAPQESRLEFRPVIYLMVSVFSWAYSSMETYSGDRLEVLGRLLAATIRVRTVRNETPKV